MLKVGRKDRYLLDMSDSLFPRGLSVCQLAFARADTSEGYNGLLQCELASNSTVSQDVTFILRSYVPDKEVGLPLYTSLQAYVILVKDSAHPLFVCKACALNVLKLLYSAVVSMKRAL